MLCSRCWEIVDAKAAREALARALLFCVRWVRDSGCLHPCLPACGQAQWPPRLPVSLFVQSIMSPWSRSNLFGACSIFSSQACALVDASVSCSRPRHSLEHTLVKAAVVGGLISSVVTVGLLSLGLRSRGGAGGGNGSAGAAGKP